MAACLLITLALAAPAAPQAVVENEGVRISVSVESQRYRWKVANVAAQPVARFELRTHNCYDHEAPDGWHHEVEDDRFQAWTDDPRRMLGRGESGIFSARVSSRGAVLGRAAAAIGTVSGGSAPPRRITLNGVWAPVERPRSLVLLVALMLAGLGTVHTVVLSRRERRRAALVPDR